MAVFGECAGLFGGLTQDTCVLTTTGARPVKDVASGMLVYGRRAGVATWSRVERVLVREYSGRIVQIKPRLLNFSIGATPDFGVLSNVLYHRSFRGAPGMTGMRFRRADEVRRDHSLVVPIPTVTWKSHSHVYRSKRAYKEHTVRFEDVAYMLGWYLGDGSLGRRKATARYGPPKTAKSERIITIKASVKDDVTRLIDDVKFKIRRSPCAFRVGNSSQISFSAKALARFIRKHFYCGDQKVIPPWLLTCKREVVRDLLEGLEAADGCDCGVRRSITSVSPGIYSLVPLLLLKLGIHSSFYHVKPSASAFPNAQPAKKIEWQEHYLKHTATALDRSLILPVREVSEVNYSGAIYAIETKASAISAPYVLVRSHEVQEALQRFTAKRLQHRAVDGTPSPY